MREGIAIGTMFLGRSTVDPFTQQQIELVTTFADQAVIAIENMRLFEAEQERTRELSESLEQQTATSEVLKVISSSSGELKPVFEAMLANATRICGATIGTLYLCEGANFRGVALHHTKQSYVDWWRRNPVVDVERNPGIPLARLARTKQTVHIPDLRADQSYIEKNDRIVTVVEVAGVRTFVSVSMLKEGELIGAINLYRQEVRPFTDKQIELVQNFAAQAVIAIDNTRLLNELLESLQQQTATADVLKVISRSAFNLQTVLDTLVESVARLCNADSASIHRPQGEAYPCIASYGLSPEFQQYLRDHPIARGRGSVLGRVVSEGKTIHVPDVLADAEHALFEQRKLGGYRTVLGVPLRREGEAIGLIRLTRNTVQPFTDKQIELVTTFADQAVIAIENVRLFDEVQARTRDLSESLQQQTATADVLKTISSSTGQLEPVFNAMLENAVRICGAKFGSLVLFEGNAYRRAALHNAPAPFVEARARDPVLPLAASPILSRVAGTKQVVQFADIAAEQPEEPIATLGGARTILSAPMLNDDRVVGVISIYRQEVRPFTVKQTELVTNFAAQAVIAIENARLLNELRQRTDRQTATAEVLKVISSSPGELKPVFTSVLENAVHLCEANFGNLFFYDGEAFRTTALHHAPSAYAESRRLDIVVRNLHPDVPLARISRTRETVHIADVKMAPAYLERDPRFTQLVEGAGARTLLVVPMLKENELVGAIAIYRQEVKPFTDKQIALVQNFAAQAVIAIENTRLLNELRESLQRQTATADVLRVISNSPGQLLPVFNAMLDNATRICDAAFGSMLLVEGDAFRRVAIHNAPPRFAEFHEKMPVVKPQQIHDLKLLLETKRPVHIADAAAADTDSPIVKYAGARTLLIVPMLKEGELIGAIGIYRQEVRPFTDKQIDLVANFAAQAVIAIENTRLLNELRESLQQQTATADVLKVISRSTFDLQV